MLHGSLDEAEIEHLLRQFVAFVANLKLVFGHSEIEGQRTDDAAHEDKRFNIVLVARGHRFHNTLDIVLFDGWRTNDEC